MLSYASCLSNSSASEHLPHLVQAALRINSCFGESPSGLWHQRHRSGQPLKKTVTRGPGPSCTQNSCMSNTMPVCKRNEPPIPRTPQEGAVLLWYSYCHCNRYCIRNKTIKRTAGAFVGQQKAGKHTRFPASNPSLNTKSAYPPRDRVGAARYGPLTALHILPHARARDNTALF